LVTERTHLATRRAGAAKPRNVHIIVQNLSVPFDRRVWLECQALVAAGYGVSVVCPAAPNERTEEVLDGVTIYRYRAPREGKGPAAFVVEYVTSFLATARLTWRAWRRHRFSVLQACNPPDIFFPLAWALRPFGVRFVFDHHDLCPELYESKFHRRGDLLFRGIRLLERATFASADRVISTNDSYRTIAIERGHKRPDKVTVVRTGPDADRLKRQDPDPALRAGRRYLVAYLGVMGPQDGVDLALRAADHLVHALGRDDVAFMFVGSGESYTDLVALRADLDLDDVVKLPGRLPDEAVRAILSTADVCLCPDPLNPLNDVSTMNKTMEYMAFSVPVVAFDLHETRVSAQDAALYATPNSIEAFANHVAMLLDDEERRRAMGAAGRRRVEDSLAWCHQRDAYLSVYADLFAEPRPQTSADLPAAVVR
jgi:glycosyltransferase involved in cell wall biosynthesis